MADKRKNSSEKKILEQGDIFFFYRPKVHPADQEEKVEGLEDIGRLYIVLHPENQTDKFRILVVGKKRMPKPKQKGQVGWATVEGVHKSHREILAELKQETYTTKTQGERELPAARPIGEGVYYLVSHQDHVHFVYMLELPEKIQEVQKAFVIEPEASYIVSVKNQAEAGVKSERKAEFPKKLQEKFNHKRFIPLDSPEFLDYEGAELLLISAAEDVGTELGLDLNPEIEDQNSADIFRHLKLWRDAHTVVPLLEGKWR